MHDRHWTLVAGRETELLQRRPASRPAHAKELSISSVAIACSNSTCLEQRERGGKGWLASGAIDSHALSATDKSKSPKSLAGGSEDETRSWLGCLVAYSHKCVAHAACRNLCTQLPFGACLHGQRRYGRRLDYATDN